MELECLTMIYYIPDYYLYKDKYIYDYIFGKILSSEDYYVKNKKRILGEYFCRNNKNKGKLIINNKKLCLQEFIEIKKIVDKDESTRKKIKIKMVLNKNLYNKSYMFKDCKTLLELKINNNLEYIEDDENFDENNYE